MLEPHHPTVLQAPAGDPYPTRHALSSLPPQAPSLPRPPSSRTAPSLNICHSWQLSVWGSDTCAPSSTPPSDPPVSSVHRQQPPPPPPPAQARAPAAQGPPRTWPRIRAPTPIKTGSIRRGSRLAQPRGPRTKTLHPGLPAPSLPSRAANPPHSRLRGRARLGSRADVGRRTGGLSRLLAMGLGWSLQVWTLLSSKVKVDALTGCGKQRLWQGAVGRPACSASTSAGGQPPSVC